MRRDAGESRPAGISWLAKRVRLWPTQWRAPVWLLVLAGVAVLVPPAGVALVVTRQPVYCASCHEMSVHYATWQQSTHREVGCDECHIVPGTRAMLESKLSAIRQVRDHAAGDVEEAAIQRHVAEANCRRCHAATSEILSYHNLKISHRAHWDMGVECTFCHDRVVHGPQWLYRGGPGEVAARDLVTVYRYAPTMETCYRCHDGTRAPNECSVCHATPGVRQPAPFDPVWVGLHRDEVKRRGRGDCLKCHPDSFCASCHRTANPHPATWLGQHDTGSESSDLGCADCHLGPLEERPSRLRDMAFCAACHSLRGEHRAAEWSQKHGEEALRDRSDCRRCHDQAWCAECHGTRRSHPDQWLSRHPSEATRDPRSCRACHQQDFCDTCHQGADGIPASHDTHWLAAHGGAAAEREESCRTCHEPTFCRACHERSPPASHDLRWPATHGDAARPEADACVVCHGRESCDSCHGVPMPHPGAWDREHATAGVSAEVCQECHGEQSCAGCHQGAVPMSHRAEGWFGQHGAAALARGESCALCHRGSLCTACHGTDMPHPAGWSEALHGASAEDDDDVCVRCHQRSDCDDCHGTEMPHPSDWIGKHGPETADRAPICRKCHWRGHSDCSTCHAALMPPDHQAAEWTSTHAQAGAEKPDVCVLCHGAAGCAECHA